MEVEQRTRSGVLAARRAERAHQLQDTHNQWEASNPAWARRLTGPAAASALGYGPAARAHEPGAAPEQQWKTRSEMLHARKVTARVAAFRTSGFDAATQRELSSHEPDTLTTSLSRATTNPSLMWREDAGCRSQLLAERRADNVVTLTAGAERQAREGFMDAEARVQRRIDRTIVALQSAPVGKSRHELLEKRREERTLASQAAYDGYRPQKPPYFSAQPAPFWELQRTGGDGRQPREYATSAEAGSRTTLETKARIAAATAERVTATLPPEAPDVAAAQAAAARAAAVVATPASALEPPELLPSGSQSLEMLKARQRWWAKPDVYPAISPAVPRAEEPFKIAPDDTVFLARKLSSGAKKAQRGYPPQAVLEEQVASKITGMPPPEHESAAKRLLDDPRMKPFRQYTGATFKFQPSEPREVLVPGAEGRNFDGYEFTQPLYSSFNADKTFQPAKLPPRRQPRDSARDGVALRERTPVGRVTGAVAPRPVTAVAMGGGGFGSLGAYRPGTAPE